jgi:hypothetical protein
LLSKKCMGMDIVEFVMAVEEEFEINIPDNIAATFVNPKLIIDFVTLQANGKYSRDEVAEKIWTILVYLTEINRESFNENSRFVEEMGLD